METERREFYSPEHILQTTRDKIEQARRKKEKIDYITFVADGEPTLDIHLGRTINLLKPLGVKIAVITNTSLIQCTDVQQDLMLADRVSLKIDTVDRNIWRRIDRPHKNLELPAVLNGALEFAERFKGELITETMLVKTVNDGKSCLHDIAVFLAGLKPATAFISIPTRPPALKSVCSPDENTINQAYHIFHSHIRNVECLIGYEGNAFAFTGNAATDLLSITAVHPMREDAVAAFLKKASANWEMVDRLIDQRQLLKLHFENHIFYMRRLDAPVKNHH